MLNFEVCQVQFRLATGEQSDFGAGGSESKGQPFTDTTAGARYQNTRVGQRMHPIYGSTEKAGLGAGDSGLGLV
jgi:hypothetical protein